jgi:hypothetical protein
MVMDRSEYGGDFRMLTVIDEHTRQCLAIRTERKLNHEAVLEILAELFLRPGPPKHIQSDKGSEFTAVAVRDWPQRHPTPQHTELQTTSPADPGISQQLDQNRTVG